MRTDSSTVARTIASTCAVACIASLTLSSPATGQAAVVRKPERILGFHGRFIDESGQPVAGARIEDITDSGRDAARAASVQSSDTGEFTIRFSMPSLLHAAKKLRISAEGRVSLEVNVHRLYDASRWTGDDVADFGSIVLTKGVTLVGQVRDEKGLPLSAVRVRGTDLALPFFYFRDSKANLISASTTTTEERGVFKLSGVPPNAVRIAVQRDGYFDQFREPVSQGTPLTFSMQRGGIVSGRAVDARGNGVEATLYISYESESLGWNPFRTSKDGAFRANLTLPGRYRVRSHVVSTDSPSLLSRILQGPQQDVVVAPSAGGKAGDVAAAKGFVWLHVKSKTSGKRIADYDLSFRPGSHRLELGHLMLHGMASTLPVDATDRARLPKATAGQLVIRAPGFATAALPVDGTGVRSRPERLTFELEKSGVIEGRVLGEDGKPIANAQVWSLLIGRGELHYGMIPPTAVRARTRGTTSRSRSSRRRRPRSCAAPVDEAAKSGSATSLVGEVVVASGPSHLPRRSSNSFHSSADRIRPSSLSWAIRSSSFLLIGQSRTNPSEDAVAIQ